MLLQSFQLSEQLSQYRDSIDLSLPSPSPSAIEVAWSEPAHPPVSGAALRQSLDHAFRYLFEEYLDYSSDGDLRAARRRVPTGVSSSEQARLIRDLLTMRPGPLDAVPDNVLESIDRILQVRSAQHVQPLVPVSSIPSILDHLQPLSTSTPSSSDSVLSRISFYHGDITRLSSPSLAIVNAANTRALGCFQPSHLCIDNVIHAAAGPRLRMDCARVMEALGREDLEVGEPIVTKGWSLPAGYVVHVAGPQLHRGEQPGEKQALELVQAYSYALDLADAVSSLDPLLLASCPH